ncbi:ATP synthase F1 subunit delta [Desulfohalovibrio reitneri]|uniref:ATP synthase F1 subunit delta n=1 Tax=Desulfohalovibrio reitneri TaxID=1307759 RepID=UPI0004A70C50|nr:ATP synthase F1 subunit delta [Desulfohalovibrio reitneri]
MTENIVARRYAKALFSLGARKGDKELEAIGKDLASVAETFAAAPDLIRTFRNPLFSAQEKSAVAAKVLDKLGVKGTVRNFVLLLGDKDRLGYLPGIERVFSELLDERQGVLRGSLVTAVDIPEDTRESLKKRLEEQTKATLVLGYEVDPDILGGVVLKVGDKVLDASLRAQLSMLKENMTRGE